MATSEATLAAARELIERRGKATPDEWYEIRQTHRLSVSNGECYRIDIRGHAIRSNGKIVGSTPVCSMSSGFVWFEGDAAFITHAATHAAAIAEALLAAEAENARLRAALQAVCDQHGPWCDKGCPGDDTCNCSAKPLHDQINEAMRKDGGK